MPIAITEAHRELADVARSFLEKEDARGAARSALDAATDGLPPFWADLAELGWLGLHVAEDHGGAGYGLLELAVVAEELGRVVAPGPFLPTVVAAAILDAFGTDDQRHRLLPGLVDGSVTAGLGLSGPDRSGEGGTWPAVLGAETAGLLLLVEGADLLVLRRDAKGVSVGGRANIDPTRRSQPVTLDSTATGGAERLVGAAASALRTARVVAAAEASGGARACVDMATEYAKVRQQFGRTIATFQAVKHRCAEMLAAAERAVAATWDAARASGSDAEADLAATIATHEAVAGYLSCAKSNIQVHGGIGYTWEHDGHVHLRRAGALAALFGPVDGLAAAVAEQADSGALRSNQIDLPPEAEGYRSEVRSFLAGLEGLDDAARTAAFLDQGYAHPHWPRPWGRGAGPVEQLVIDQEMRGVTRPGVLGIGAWIVLTLAQHTTSDQAEHWIRPSMEGRMTWCQLFSEPDAGSDAAGIRTRGRRVEGGWLVNGQKIWTSGAQAVSHGLATVRTDPDAPKHAGITTMVIDMKAPGVGVRPLREATGNAMFNEVFFSDVFVPDDDVVGPVDGGWTVARSTLGNERVSIGSQGAGAFVELLATYRAHRNVPGAAAAVGRLLAERETLRIMNLRQAERAVVGVPGPEGNLSKMVQAEHAQRVADLAHALAGVEGAYTDGAEAAAAMSYLFTRCLTIAGGTSEIVRNQIAERILEMPRDPLIQ